MSNCRAALWLILASTATTPLHADLEELPRPALEAFERAAREHLVAERRALDGKLESEVSEREQSEAFGRFAKVYYGYELYGQAAIAWRNALELQPEDARWLYLLGLLQRIEGEWSQAVDLLRRAVAADGGNLAGRIHLGRVLLDLGDVALAEAQFQAVRESQPTSAAAALGLARVALAEGRYEDAIQWASGNSLNRPPRSVIASASFRCSDG